MTIRFDEDHLVEYPFDKLDDLELAYAVTVHKSQGSEYPAVLLPVLGGPKGLLTRNLLYTAVTRAKKCVVLLGSEQAFREMENNTAENRRLTGLRDRIDDIKQASGYGPGSPLPEEMPDL
jgi:exodeoxyribonuclease V alpha subunit